MKRFPASLILPACLLLGLAACQPRTNAEVCAPNAPFDDRCFGNGGQVAQAVPVAAAPAAPAYYGGGGYAAPQDHTVAAGVGGAALGYMLGRSHGASAAAASAPRPPVVVNRTTTITHVYHAPPAAPSVSLAKPSPYAFSNPRPVARSTFSMRSSTTSRSFSRR